MENSISSQRVNILQRHLTATKRSIQNNQPDSLGFKNLSVERSNSSLSSSRKPNHNSIPIRRQEILKWNGWGFKDSHFLFDAETRNMSFTGSRYKICENPSLPHMPGWIEDTIGPLTEVNLAKPLPLPSDYPKPTINEKFMESVINSGFIYSIDGEDRLFRAHGHTVAELFALREGKIPRMPDFVVWPECHSDVEKIVALAEQNGVVIIPFGGGTSVSGALICPANEDRMIVSLDTSQMSRIIWINEHNLTARVEAGIIGQDLEREMFSKGFTVGHEPDSYEFSSLGGWVATRASGMKKNHYGNIEDIVVQVKVVTPRGTVEKFSAGPRISAGPDVNQMMLGSEGTLGVVTEVTLKIRPLPETKRFGSLVFPDFESGVAFMRNVALEQCQPSSIRLMDNEQFKFGHALKSPSTLFGLLTEGISKLYITKIKGFDVNKICVTTLLFEGSAKDVDAQEVKIKELCYKHGGVPAGAVNGERGYMLTYVIAYIRDIAFDFFVVSESFETSVPWDKLNNMCTNVKASVTNSCKAFELEYYFMSCRVTQTYDAGACVYFYFGFNHKGISDPVHVFELIENAARDEIIACGGNISHHHGIGKIRRKWMKQTMTTTGFNAIKALKDYFDPTNVFACGNLI